MDRKDFDQWQKDFINCKGDKLLDLGRQGGKSEVCGADCGEYAIHNKNKQILMIAPTERQAQGLFNKTLDYLARYYPKYILKGRKAPTKHIIQLSTGCVVRCYPTGQSGTGVRFLTTDRVYMDEAARIPEEVISAVTPQLFTTGGKTILLSTPYLMKGYWYDCKINKDEAFNSFTRFKKTSKQIIDERPISKSWPEWRRKAAYEHLEKEKARLPRLIYEREYECKLTEDIQQMFPDALIKSCQTIEKGAIPFHIASNSRYLGVDVARLGGDQTVLASGLRVEDRLVMIDLEYKQFTRITETSDMIEAADKQYQYRRIYIDTGGVGGGVFDILFRKKYIKHRIVAIDNASKDLSTGKKKDTKTINKDELYANLLILMEQGRIDLLKDNELFQSLKSVQHVEDLKTGRTKIYGDNTHCAEALIRLAHCMAKKPLNVWFA